MYLTVGTGGNTQAASKSFIDKSLPSFCKNPAQFKVGWSSRQLHPRPAAAFEMAGRCSSTKAHSLCL